MTGVPSWFLVNRGSSRIPSREEPFSFTGTSMTQPTPIDEPQGHEVESSAEAPERQTRRVQVVERWNSWVRVYDPEDESLTWVNLAEQRFAQA